MWAQIRRLKTKIRTQIPFLTDGMPATVVPTPTNRIYLDYAAATPLDPRVRAAMDPFFATDYANAGGIHEEAVVAKRALESARERVARVLGIQPTGVVFTSGGTESNNLALRGAVAHLVAAGRSYADCAIISTAVEHPATLQTLAHLESQGVRVVLAPVTGTGAIDLVSLRQSITPQTVLVSVTYVNSEVGTITDVRAVRRLLDEVTRESGQTILLHVDAAQAPLWLPCDLPRLGADLLSLDAGKCGGPKGVGILAFRKGVTLAPIMFGGGQEMGLRPGTEPLPLVVGAATAISLAQEEYVLRAASVTAVREYAFTKIAEALPTAVLNGARGRDRVANNVHISIPGIDAEFAVITLDAHGIAASTKSACSSKGGGASKVVLAMTGDTDRALSTLRFTLGPTTTTADIDKLLAVLSQHFHTSRIR